MHAQLLTFVTVALLANSVAAQAEASAEAVSVGVSFVMLLFLAITALIVVSILCKVAILARLVPKQPVTRVQRATHVIAQFVGTTRLVPRGRDRSRNVIRSGGSFGGGGSGGTYR